MHELKERMAYIKGLSSGLNLNENSPEGRILLEMMELLDGIVRAVDQLAVQQNDLEEYLGAVDEDLTDLEQDFYDEYDDYDDYEEEDLVCEACDEADDDIQYLEMECPHCHGTVFVDSTVFDDDEVVEVLCPECHETILVNDEAPVTT
ncbi:CD1247 N-terminal domain-containing protein [Effusibacillus pohliae]|uniref:CD1247 N-terminal domain-containing protein n=1 Tax=Effusibacillus pohliae TaxID=232270 RepID=UPI000360E697|nr:CD1247 N-terminal domain-containing protein [Effusibacillus pohliae]